jgi:hypothetical protein
VQLGGGLKAVEASGAGRERSQAAGRSVGPDAGLRVVLQLLLAGVGNPHVKGPVNQHGLCETRIHAAAKLPYREGWPPVPMISISALATSL